MKLHLDRRWENGLVFKTTRTKIHQNFLASKYDIKQHSDATYEIIWTAAWLAQLGERRSAEREVTGSNPGWTNTQGL